MKIYTDLSQITAPLTNAAATIGNFDGVHLGHRELFRRVKRAARTLGGTSVVVTFAPHPLKLLAPEKSPPLINTMTEKEFLIEASGIDCLVVIPFDRDFAAISAEDFIRRILVEKIGVRHLVIGYDYAFGRGREGNVDLLRRIGAEAGFTVDVMDPVGTGATIVSSSSVRSLIADGDVAGIIPLLGRHFSVGGKVIHGHHRGKGLGFPTANVATDKELLPKRGVYAVKVKVDDLIYDGACNIGSNPTFGDVGVSIEVFLFDFDGDLYGRDIRIFFVERLRDERKFADAAELVAAIESDVARCREVLEGVSIIECRDFLEEV